MKSVAAIALTYCAVALIAFGSILAPIFFLTEWSDRLGAPSWRLIVFGCTLFSAGIVLALRPWLRPAPLRMSLFAALSMASATAAVGLYSDGIRKDRIARFGADQVVDHSFFQSIREAPREHQVFVHSAALRNCVPYAWSYRTMSLYRLPVGVAKNVVPTSWGARCPNLRAWAGTALHPEHGARNSPASGT